MHNHQRWFRDEAWQRVVDNELTADEFKELVAVCDQHPELWRCCAIAFLEEQALRSELKQFAVQWHAPTAPSQSTESGLHAVAGQDAVMQRGDAKRRIAHEGGATGASLLNALALAASIGLAFLVGWQASRRMAGDATRAMTAVNQPSGATSNSARPDLRGRLASQTDAVQVHNAASDSQPAVALPSPASTADVIHQALLRPDRLMLLDRRVPKQLADLEQRGLVRIESTEGFVPVQLTDGNTALVPVQQYDVRSIDNAY